MQTTSPSYLLMGSLDVARKQLVLEGEEILNHILEVSEYARKEINKIPGCYAIGKEAVGRSGIYAFDPTKLSVTTRNMGLNGMELYDLLRDDYNIQMETGDVYNSLAILSLGDDYDHVKPYSHRSILAVFGEGEFQVQFYANTSLELLDLYYIKQSYQLKYYRALELRTAFYRVPRVINQILH